jgi:hypothetical protein
MSNLRVTDVQAALRHFSNTGHDVLTDPRALHLDGEKFKMATGHHLWMPSADTAYTHLNTSLMQSENPLISYFATSFTKPKDGIQKHHRGTGFSVPNRDTDEDGKTRDSYGLSYDTSAGYHEEESEAPVGTTLWTPYKPVHSSSVEALKSHIDHPDVNRKGKVFVGGDFRNPREMSPEDRFDHVSALKEHSYGLEPFSGHIFVQQGQSKGSPKNYVYHPDTEQLLDYK